MRSIQKSCVCTLLYLSSVCVVCFSLILVTENIFHNILLETFSKSTFDVFFLLWFRFSLHFDRLHPLDPHALECFLSMHIHFSIDFTYTIEHNLQFVRADDVFCMPINLIFNNESKRKTLIISIKKNQLLSVIVYTNVCVCVDLCFDFIF